MINHLDRARTPEVEGAILGSEEFHRTPLHIDFPNREQFEADGFADVKVLSRPNRCNDETFNAIGSKVVGEELHMPVLDLDHGVHPISRKGAGFIINCNEGHTAEDSVLADIVGDYGLGKIEVIQKSGIVGRSLYRINTRTTAIRWRPENEDDFVWVPSSSKGGAHLLIQKSMSPADHEQFLKELWAASAIDTPWLEIARASGVGGVIRTPWVSKHKGNVSTSEVPS